MRQFLSAVGQTIGLFPSPSRAAAGNPPADPRSASSPMPQLRLTVSSGERGEIFVFDVSPSAFMGRPGTEPIRMIREAATKYLRSLDATGQPVVVSLIIFDSEPELVESRVRPAMLASRLAEHTQPAGAGTYFCEALLAAETEAEAHSASKREPPTRVLFFTDGDHNGGGDPIAIARRLKESGIEIWCIGCGPEESAVNMQLLRQMASTDRDGRPLARYASTPTAVAEAFDEFAEGLEA